MKDVNIIGYVMLALLAVPVLLTIFSGPIAEWLNARADRKKAAAKAAETATKPS
ncbi:MAG: hypothetical protein OXU94_02460 [Gammaproteobacteria bacterium]|nr:hypothetical protein [Gammaproteobacteria bacterium]MDD9850615.1 hypothetical protein [Gammaproteobacteria bacterium]